MTFKEGDRQKAESLMTLAHKILTGETAGDVDTARCAIEWCREARQQGRPENATTNSKRKRARFTEDDPPSSLVDKVEEAL